MAPDKCRSCREVELGIIVGDHPFGCECHLMPTGRLPVSTEDALLDMKEQAVVVFRELDNLWDMIDEMSWTPKLRLVE